MRSASKYLSPAFRHKMELPLLRGVNLQLESLTCLDFLEIQGFAIVKVSAG